MARPQLSATTRALLKTEKVGIMAFFQIETKPGSPYFLAAKWPMEEGESILLHDKNYMTAEASTAEECVQVWLGKAGLPAQLEFDEWGGL